MSAITCLLLKLRHVRQNKPGPNGSYDEVTWQHLYEWNTAVFSLKSLDYSTCIEN